MYLGIDLGTSALKVILIDDDQNLLGEKNIPLEVNRPQTLFSEQSPEEWWNASPGRLLLVGLFKGGLCFKHFFLIASHHCLTSSQAEEKTFS